MVSVGDTGILESLWENVHAAGEQTAEGVGRSLFVILRYVVLKTATPRFAHEDRTSQ